MADKSFEFMQLSDFTAPTDLDDLMRRFQTVQAYHERTIKACNQARLEYEQWQEYTNLCTEYKKLFGSMVKKLLDARTGTDIQKIRTAYSDRLVPILQKVAAIQAKLQGQLVPDEILPGQAESKADIADKFDKIRALFNQATKLKDEITINL